MAQGLEDAVAAGMTSCFTVVLGVVWGSMIAAPLPLEAIFAPLIAGPGQG